MAEFGRQLADLVMMPQSSESAPTAPALPPGTPEMKPYDPTVRERMAQALQSGMERMGMDRYKARQNAQSIMGGPSSALPIGGIADFVPFLGTALQSQEAIRGGEAAIQSAKEGDYIGAAVEAGFAGLGMIPGAVGTSKAVRSMRSKAKAGDAVRNELNNLLGVQTQPKEQKMLQGFYRGYAGDYDAGKAAAQDAGVFVSPQRRVGEFYAGKRAGQTGEKPHVEMILADPFAGREYGHATSGTGRNPPIMTRARELASEDVKGRTQLKKGGGKVEFTDNIDAMRLQLARGGGIKEKVKSAIKEAVKPNAVVKTYKTTDGYTFYELGSGKIVDNKKPSQVDMSWPNRQEFMTDMEGTAFEAGDELGLRRATTESYGVPTQEKLIENITQFGEDDTSRFYAARKKQIEDAERRAKLSVVPSGPKISAVPSVPKMDPQDFVRFAEKGMIRWAKDQDQEMRDFLAGKSKFAELSLDWDDPSTYDLINPLEAQGFKVTLSQQGPNSLTYLYRDPQDVELILRAQNPAQYGKAYGYSDEDIARFYWERGLGPERYAEDMATVAKPDEGKAAGGAIDLHEIYRPKTEDQDRDWQLEKFKYEKYFEDKENKSPDMLWRLPKIESPKSKEEYMTKAASGGYVSPDPIGNDLKSILGLKVGGEVAKAKAKEKLKQVFTPKQVEKTAEKMADKIKKDNPKLTDDQVMAKAKKDAEKKLQWEKVDKPALEKTYGPLEKAPYSASLAERKKNVPEVVEKRIEETKRFLEQPTEPWTPPRKELQAFDRALIKDAMEGFPGIEQTRFPRYTPPRSDLSYIEEIYGDPVNRALIEGQIKRGLPLGGETFYASLYPLKVAALERGIPEDKFNLFVHSIAPASARNSIFNEMAVGQFLRDMHARGLPLDEKTVTQEMAKFKEKYGIGLPLMPVHREGVKNVLEGSQDLRELLKADIPTNYKIPTYGTQKAGDFGQSMVLDVHEAAGQTRGSRYHPYFTEQGGFGPTEYGAAESQMLDIAQGLGLPGGTAQAGRWFGGGELTGLKSPRGDALDLLERQTAYTLANQGITPTPRNVRNTLLDMIETGQGLFLPYFKKEGMPDLRVEKKKGGAVKKRKVKITDSKDAQMLALLKKG